jgi:hypothetical protein
MPTPIPFVARRMQPLGHAPRSSVFPSQVSIAHSRLPMPMFAIKGTFSGPLSRQMEQHLPLYLRQSAFLSAHPFECYLRMPRQRH